MSFIVCMVGVWLDGSATRGQGATMLCRVWGVKSWLRLESVCVVCDADPDVGVRESKLQMVLCRVVQRACCCRDVGANAGTWSVSSSTWAGVQQRSR